MKSRLVYLLHISDCIRNIVDYTTGLTQSDFLQNSLVQDAVIRNFEIIGEATKHLDDNFRKKYSEIEWRKIAGMRDKLIHDYIGVDLWAVWGVVEDIIPTLNDQIMSTIRIEQNENT
jgi:uncharacterized protein with HEPN domain